MAVKIQVEVFFWVVTLCSVVIGIAVFQMTLLPPSSGWRWYPATTLHGVTDHKPLTFEW